MNANLVYLRFLLIALLTPTLLAAQTTISGRIFDAQTKEGLIGASIAVIGGREGTTTDFDGNFKLKVSEGFDSIQVSYIGYHPFRFNINSIDERIQIAMQSIFVSIPSYELTNTPIGQSGIHAIPIIKRSPVRQFANTSILETLNTIPGVRMESRGDGGSRRISIRGSSLRAPFGVRNVKMYWNGIPVTSPDGSSPLEITDLEAISNLEVIKGPSANEFGGVNGGTLLFKSKKTQRNTKSVGTSLTVGENGLVRYTGHVGYQHNKLRVDLSYVNQDVEGYREQEFNHKDYVDFSLSYQLSHRHFLELSSYYFDGAWGLPGSIDSASAAENPQQALPFSVTAQARVERTRLRVGLKHRYFLNERWHLNTIVYFNTTDKENPFGTSPFFNGYKFEAGNGFGGRVVLNYNRRLGRYNVRANLGTEYQRESTDLKEFANDLGAPGILQIDNNTTSTNQFAFGKLSIVPNRQRLTVILGANVNQLTYDHEDFRNGGQTGNTDFDLVFLPHVKIKHKFLRKQSVYLDYSKGFSAPALWEVQLADGSFNQNLNAETSDVIELGSNLKFLANKLHLDVNLYTATLREAIVPSQEITGQTVYNNAGEVTQNGLEVSARYELLKNPEKFISFLNLWGTLNLQDFTFTDYVKNGTDFTGNKMTGSPDETYNFGLNVGLRSGFYINPSLQHVGAIPIRDDNTVFSDPYTLVHLRTGFRGTVGNRFQFELFGGVNNLTDATYSSFLQLNAFGGRYFNPSPSQNFYAGVSVKYTIR